jgi:acyl-CoA synthetase (AMP-forming)/AMP-acid ligase II
MASYDVASIIYQALARGKPLASLGKGDRVIVAHPPGLEFSIAVHACMKAELVFVPVYPPREGADSARLLASARVGPDIYCSSRQRGPRRGPGASLYTRKRLFLSPSLLAT